MKLATYLAALVFLALPLSAAVAGPFLGPLKLLKWQNERLQGRVCDHTNHHGADRRIWSAALCEWRSVYVYLPPGFDPNRRYPLVVWLHGVIDDDRVACTRDLPFFDRAIAAGRLPPLIVVIPNGRICPQFHPDTPLITREPLGPAHWFRWDRGFPFDSHFVNNRAGRFEDYLLHDVLPFVERHYPVRPEPEAHAVVGFSLSGWAAYAVALKNTHIFGAVIGLLPPLNMRWMDCHGNYRADFDPWCWGWRNELDKNETLGRAWGVRATLRRSIEPYFGWGPEGLAWLSSENPIELLDRCDIRPGDLAMYVAYIRNDEFNLDAQAESFLFAARQRGLCVTVDYDPVAPSHTVFRALKMLPAALDWLGTCLAPYAPSHCTPVDAAPTLQQK